MFGLGIASGVSITVPLIVPNEFTTNALVQMDGTAIGSIKETTRDTDEGRALWAAALLTLSTLRLRLFGIFGHRPLPLADPLRTEVGQKFVKYKSGQFRFREEAASSVGELSAIVISLYSTANYGIAYYRDKVAIGLCPAIKQVQQKTRANKKRAL